MNALQNDQKQGTSHPQDSPITSSAVDQMKLAKPVGAFAGSTDLILRFHNGKLIAADTGDQGGGQN